MNSTRTTRSILAAIAVAGLLSVPVAANAAPGVSGKSAGAPLAAELSGTNEVDGNGQTGVGDPNGIGTAAVTINIGKRQLCYDINFSLTDNAAPLFGHIHVGEAGVNGGVVITLGAVAGSTTGTANGCATVTREQLREILHDPSGFYINIHSPAFSLGAIRGQLSR
jgi:hypothetical protein